MTDWHCTFHYPRNWIEVVHQPGSSGGGLSGQVQEAIDRTLPPDPTPERQQLAEVVTRWIQDDAERDAAVSAHGYDGGIHMHLAMWVTERSLPESVDDELRLLSDTVREAGANVEPPQVTDVALPAGRALRVRQRDETPLDGAMTQIDTVDYWVPAGPSRDLLWLHFWTPDLMAADGTVALFDRMAEAFVLEAG